jgi:GNAT superfamily N-acetyltransferase
MAAMEKMVQLTDVQIVHLTDSSRQQMCYSVLWPRCNWLRLMRVHRPQFRHRIREGAGMVTVRSYEQADAAAVGRLIADTYSDVNLSFLPTGERGPFLGPFQHARSPESSHQKAIADVIRASIVFVAVDDGEIVGVLRGKKDQLQSLFVRGDRHRQGIGRRLVGRFENECIRQGGTVIRLAATMYAIPFYLSLGYKRSTGVRSGWSFEGHGLRYQPMKKVLTDPQRDAP